MLHAQFQFPNELDHLKTPSLEIFRSRPTQEWINASATLKIKLNFNCFLEAKFEVIMLQAGKENQNAYSD